MWVDTKGEDGPQCIHHTPVGALMAQPPPSRSCRSLQYALQNILYSTSINIRCGTYKLQPDYYIPPNVLHLQAKEMLALTIQGACATSRPTVQFVNVTTAATFMSFSELVISDVVVEGYNKIQGYQNPKPADIEFKINILNCTNVTIHHVTVHVSGQHGAGIVLSKIANNGRVTMRKVTIVHNGRYGAGIYCDIQGIIDAPANNISLLMNEVQVINTNSHTKYDPSMWFMGVQITARGTGNGTKISLYNVTVFNSAPVAGFGIYIFLSGDMHNSTVNLMGVNILDGWNKHYSNKNKNDVLTECARRQLEMIRSKANNTAYASVSVQVQTSHNTINITGVHVVTTYGPITVSGLHLQFQGLANLNTVYLQGILISANGNLTINKFGLLLHFTGNASHNNVIAGNVQVLNCTTASGAGAKLFFNGHSSTNNVLLKNSMVANCESKEIGGASLLALFTDYAKYNNISIHRIIVKNNTAKVGGGIMVQFGGFSSGNGFSAILVLIADNKAHIGGGVSIEFVNFTESNTVNLFDFFIINNRLIPSPNIGLMGGGMSAYFGTIQTMLATKNRVLITDSAFINNNARGGVGGGLSLLYVHSPYTGDSGDTVHINNTQFINNQAKNGHAFAMQSSPQYRKAIFRGINSTNNNIYHTNVENFTDKINDVWKKMLYKVTLKEYNASKELIYLYREMLKIDIMIKTAMSEFKKWGNPIFQIQTNSCLVLLVSVQISIQAKIHCIVEQLHKEF